MADMTTAGDNDEWILLERQSSDGYPMVVRSRVNNSEIREFIDDNSVGAIICDVFPEYVNDNGMPDCMDDLYRLEDKIVATFEKLSSPVFHTASATGDGRRTMYFAHLPDFELDKAAADTESEFGDIQVFTDFDLATYQDFVTPTRLDIQLAADHRVMQALQEQGDDGQIPRPTDFWFYGEKENLDRLYLHLKKFGYQLNHWIENSSGIVLTRETSADSKAFQEITHQLLNAADEFGVEYDGWETMCIQQTNDDVQEVSQQKPSLWSKIFGSKDNK